MCYDISFKADVKELSDYFPDLKFDDQIEIDFDKSAHILGPGLFPEIGCVHRQKEDQRLHYDIWEWGIIRFYQKDYEKRNEGRTFGLNIKVETLKDPKSYAYKIRHRRCVVPVTGIFEHRQIQGWKKMVPYKVQLEDRPIYTLPALYSFAEMLDVDGVIHSAKTLGILTCPANKLMQQIHNHGDRKFRMPLFLTKELEDAWLSDLTDQQIFEICDFQMPSEKLSPCPVYTIRSLKPRPDNKAKDEFWEWENLPDLVSA